MEENNCYKSNFHLFLEQVGKEPISTEEASQSLTRLADFIHLLSEIDRANMAKKQNEKTSNN